MKVLMVARDVAPSKAFEKISEELVKDGGVKVISTYLGYGKPLQGSVAGIKRAVSDSDVVLIGMSSSKKLAKEEIATGEEARKKGIPYGFYADTYGCHARSWFSHLMSKASFLFVINQKEAESAKKLYPKAKIVISGNPLWERFCFPKLSREEIREKLGIKDSEVMVLSPGVKSVPINSYLWVSILQALNAEDLYIQNLKIRVVFSPHPGDKAFQNDPMVYGHLEEFSDIPVKVISPEILRTSEMIAGADIVIASASTVGIEAAHQRKPVIDYFSDIALNRMESTFGSKSWKPCELGVSEEVMGCPEKLAEAIHCLLVPGGFTPMRAHQKGAYPKPSQKGTSIRTIVEALFEITRPH